jgi:RepB DNA-primase from phage plasmid
MAAIGLTPHIVVKSSEGKYHIYWCMNDAPLLGFGKTQKKLAAIFGSDPAVSDLCRVLRVPGFPNQKDASCGNLVCLTYMHDGENYSDTVFQEALDKASAAEDSTLKPPPAPAWSAYEDAKLRSALDYVDATGKHIWDPNASYEIWGKIVAPAIASLGWGEKGEKIFINWSAQTTIVGLFPGDEECRNQVRSYKKRRDGGCITEATIYKGVIDAGWTESQIGFSNQSNSSNTSANGAGTTASQLGGLPTINVTGGGLSNEATAGEDAIIRAGHQIYRRGTVLVRPVIQEVDATRGRTTKVAQLISVTQPYMVDLLCKVAKWERYDRRLKQNIRINPPDNIASVILHRCGEWNFNEVVGVITTPTLRSDDSLLIQPGYDPITRMILMEPPPMPPVAERPTRDDAMAALSLLDGLLDEFPFADTASRSVALSALITPVVRGAFTVAPMHAADAPVAGTGKSFLFDTAAAIAIGQPCPVMAAGRNEEETEKRLGAALLAGQPIISIDNVNGELGGDALCQIVERPVIEIRILGKSERVRIEARCTLFSTGNNLVLVADMTRRGLRCTLDANQERPELRQFKRDPVAEVLADRGRYIAAVLTIVRAYIAAGRPRVASRLPSFEGWSDTVRSALIWLARPDPVDTMEAARKDDPTLRAMEAVFAALKETIGIRQKSTVAEIIKLADQRVQATPFDPPSNSLGDRPLNHPGLKEALQNIAGDRAGFIDSRTLGKWFSRHKGRIAQGVRLEREADQHGHPARWYLLKCG